MPFLINRAPLSPFNPANFILQIPKTEFAVPTIQKKKIPDEIALFARKHCLNEGVLLKKGRYLYLKLDECYLDRIFEKIRAKAPEIEPLYSSIGPHISVIRHNEWKGLPKRIEGIAKKYLFRPMHCEEVKARGKRLWVLVVKPSSEIVDLRKEFGLRKFPYGKKFHVTIGQTSKNNENSSK